MSEEKELEFSLDIFVRKMNSATSLGEDSIKSQTRTLEVMRMILDNDYTTPELLKSCSIIELEWVFDILLYWPSYEGERDEIDWDHYGVQHAQIRDLVNGLSRKKSIKRQVTFI